MSVYVDDMRARLGRMVMCHMVADTTAELLDMAAAIGLPRHWIQQPGGAYEHFDVCREKRTAAVKLGAREVTQRQLVARRLILRAKLVPAADPSDWALQAARVEFGRPQAPLGGVA